MAGANVILQVNQSPVKLVVAQELVQLKVSGGRGSQGQPANTDVGLCFQGNLKPSERLGFVLTGEASFTDAFCRGKITPGSAPAAPEILTVYYNNVAIGTVSINTDESVTSSFGTINAVDSDVVELGVSNTPSLIIQNFKYTFSGIQ